MTQAQPLKLVSSELCPYVERSRIVLLEKRVPHDLEIIDLANKPDWFLRLSPMGRVPLLLVGDRPVFESMIINELLEELHPQPALLPKDPLARAEARGWIVFANEVLMPAAFAASVTVAGGVKGEALAKPLATIADALAKLEPQVRRGGGPYFAGAGFSLVDATYAPFFRRWRVTESWGGDELKLLAPHPALSAWADALLARESVRAAQGPDFAERTRVVFEGRARKAAAS